MIRPFKILLLLTLVSVPGYASFKGKPQHGKRYVGKEFLVQFSPSASSSTRIQSISAKGHIHVKSFGAWSHVKIPSGQSLSAAMTSYAKDPNVLSVQPNYIYHILSTVPNDPSYSQLWALNNNRQTIHSSNGPDLPDSTANPGTPGQDISAERAWDLITDCSSVIVAVIDTGINYNHEDLAANMWNGGSQYPLHGYNFVDGNNDPMDKNGHGTHVSGTIGAVGNNGVGTTGVCWKVKLMALRVLDASGSGTSADIGAAIEFAVAHGAKVMNMSFGGSDSDPAVNSAMVAAAGQGVIAVTAAGNFGSDNDSTPTYPCNYGQSNIVCVAALDQNFGLASFSNYGASSVHVGAPGINILSSWSGTTVSQTPDNNQVPANWTRSGTTGPWGFTTHPFNTTSSGIVTLGLLVNPANWTSPSGSAQYALNSNGEIYRGFDLSGASKIYTATIQLVLNTKDGNDGVVISCNKNAGDPFASGSVTLDALTGHNGNAVLENDYDLSACTGASNAPIGFQFLSDSNGTDTGAAILPVQINSLTLNTNTYNVIEGTSMATPHVTGLAALIWAYNPSYTYSDVIEAIERGGVPNAALSGKTSSGNSINALGSLTYISSPKGVTVSKD